MVCHDRGRNKRGVVSRFRRQLQAALDERLIAQPHDDARTAAEGKPVVRHYIQRQDPESQS